MPPPPLHTGSLSPARSILRLLPLFAAISVAVVVLQVALHLRNIPFWDEVDGVLANLPRIDLSQPWPDAPANLFALQNEHRTFTSNLLFATVYRLTGTLNFAALAVLGNLYLLLACAVLIERAGAWTRALRLAAIFGLLLIHLQHHESLFWAGSSIDHFHIVLLAVAAFAALTLQTRLGLLGAILFGLLGTYTLAHGFAIWPVGAVVLAAQRRWRGLALWCGIAAAAVACYLPGFAVNPAHHVEVSAHLGRVLPYWLALLGATPAVSHLGLAPWCGAALLGAVGWLAWRGGWRAEPLAAAVVTFCILALALVAVGRTGVSGGILLPSRYCVLSALAWALTVWVWLEHELARPVVRWRPIAAVGVMLIAVNLALNVRFWDEGARFARQREDSAQWFHYYHTLEGAPFALYPRATQADRIFRAAAERGIYTLPNPSGPVAIASAQPVDHIRYVFDELKADGDNVYVRGWAFVPERAADSGEIHIVFQSADARRVYKALSVARPDVAAAFHDERVAQSGFRLVLPRRELPRDSLAVGVLFTRAGAPAEFALSAQRLEPSSGAASATRLLTHR